jgi:hypothetical protein
MAKPNNTPETDYATLAALDQIFRQAFIETESKAEELFGRSEYCSDDEFEIIFDNRLSHAEKVAAVKTLRRKTVN